MKLSYFHIVRRSIIYNLKGVIAQIAVIILLTAVITGSLMTGSSVRESLKRTSFEKLGNAGILISSGVRYVDPSLADRITENTGIKSTGLLEIEGYCQHFTTQKSSPGVNIYAVDEKFFPFLGGGNEIIRKGEVAVNRRLADYIGLKQGDELIIRFNAISDIPANAPFSPDKNTNGSVVLKTSRIIEPENGGNFSLSISQITPLNIFLNRSDLSDSKGSIPKINRILLDGSKKENVSDIIASLKKLLFPEDIGLKIRNIPATNSNELISDRVFLDKLQVDELEKIIPSAAPVVTYLANSITYGAKAAPYSFVAAIGPTLSDQIPDGNGILINNWLSEDIGAVKGDTINMKWYSTDQRNHLIEESADFIVNGIVTRNGIFADSLLMPEFEGISGKESCTSWDAGVSIDMNLIRKKDEAYWNMYRGTPKAFINYSKGKELWANNFGPATSIRFDQGVSAGSLRASLSGSLDPLKSGFTVTDLPYESKKAADESVDFSTLFLSLGFFIIFSAIILLILVVTTYLNSKKKQIKTLYSLGFSNGRIKRLIISETGTIALVGAIAGAFSGLLFNTLIIKALNSVWRGAVQTNALVPYFDLNSVCIGFLSSFILIIIILVIKVSSYLKDLDKSEKGLTPVHLSNKNRLISILLVTFSIIGIALSFVSDTYPTIISFGSGILLFASIIFLIRGHFINRQTAKSPGFQKKYSISDSYYSFNPSQAIAPVIFIAAGLFAVIITGANRLTLSDSALKASGGTGGYLLWGESSLPLVENLSDSKGKQEFGLDDPELKDLSVIQALKTSGNDASCLNLNHIVSPPILGIDPSDFIRNRSFSFATKIKNLKVSDPWEAIEKRLSDSTVYGIADQTVLEYGLKIKTGDTLKIRTENGRILNIIIAAGLKSSVFQGFVIIGSDNFKMYFPSIQGSSVFLANGNGKLTDFYKGILEERLSEYGAHFEPAGERLSSFFVVTNTYLSVFMILGGFGMILGVVGLGFILLRNFNQRKRDFGLMMATGFSVALIRKIVFIEQVKILLAGIVTGVLSALVATRTSLSASSQIPWLTLGIMIILVALTALIALSLSARSIQNDSLIKSIRKE